MNDEERGDTLKNSQHKPLVRRRIRSPRSAAIAGILFALMRIISLILISSVSDPTEFSMDWLESLSGTSSVVVLSPSPPPANATGDESRKVKAAVIPMYFILRVLYKIKTDQLICGRG